MKAGPRAVLFDVDGTLVDSTDAHTIAWWHAFRRFVVDVAMWRIHRAIGMGADQLVPHVTDARDDMNIEEVANSHDAIYSTFWPELRLLPVASDLVRRCHDSGLVTVLASSAGGRELQVVRDLLDVDDCLDHTTAAEDAQASKPAPHLVGVAVERPIAPSANDHWSYT